MVLKEMQKATLMEVFKKIAFVHDLPCCTTLFMFIQIS